MKYIKVTITKIRTDIQTSFSYPEKYDAKKFNVIQYQNEWLNSEYAIATTDDNFVESKWLEELSLWQAKQLIDDFVKSDKDINDNKLLNWKTRDSIIKNKQDILWK